MNTFLAYPDFYKSAQCLDYKRLGKQRVETWQIYNILKQGEYSLCKECDGKGEVFYIAFDYNDWGKHHRKKCEKCKGTGKVKTAWYNHPVVRMWNGFELALLIYGAIICKEWIRRGYKDTLLERFNFEIEKLGIVNDNWKYPLWLGNDDFHNAMKSNLLRKDKKYYSQFGWKVGDKLPYVWGNKLMEDMQNDKNKKRV